MTMANISKGARWNDIQTFGIPTIRLESNGVCDFGYPLANQIAGGATVRYVTQHL